MHKLIRHGLEPAVVTNLEASGWALINTTSGASRDELGEAMLEVAAGLGRPVPSLPGRPLVEWYAAADVGVNPVTQGTGASTKIAQYLGAGLPVITTPLGMRGYEHERSRLQVAELDDFADAIRSFRHSKPPGVRAPLGDRTWTALGMRLHDTYRVLTAGRLTSGS